MLDQELSSWLDVARRDVADLLLNKGLYQRIELTPPSPIRLSEWTAVMPPRLQRACALCDHADQTTWSHELATTNMLGMHSYQCMNCEKSTTTFMLAMTSGGIKEVPSGPGGGILDRHLTSYAIEKVGQHPAWEAPLSRTLVKALGREGKSLFIKGSSSLRAGRGIGAVAYFRRIIENHIDDILRMVAESAAVAGDTAASEQIKAATQNLYATDRLKLAAQHTPAHLKPGGHNPLEVMYSAFSEGLHSLSDEESAVVANKLLESIAYFFEVWQENKERADRYALAITKAATKSS